jgi:DNA-binding NarL/FixJ family response regulator
MTNQQHPPVRVVDDQQLMRDGIASLLSIQEGIEVVGTSADGQEAIDQALALSPDVILMPCLKISTSIYHEVTA